jgi:hypothetical protein
VAFREAVGDSHMSGIKLMRGGKWLQIAHVLLEGDSVWSFRSNGDLGPEHWHLNHSPMSENRRVSRFVPLRGSGSLFPSVSVSTSGCAQQTYHTGVGRTLVHSCAGFDENESQIQGYWRSTKCETKSRTIYNMYRQLEPARR